MKIVNNENQNIHDAFEVYRSLMSDSQLCESNQEILTNLAYTIDSYAIATILNFYNMYPEFSNRELWKANLFMIRIFSLVSAEIINLLHKNGLIDKDSFNEPNSLKDLFVLRNKIHQFRYRDYRNKIENIDSAMGRSRNERTPHLDTILEYFTDENGTHFYGTNIYQFHFEEAKEQILVDLMQKIIRAIEKASPFLPSDFMIKKSNLSPQYRCDTYCYTDILKNSKLQNERIVDRVLLAFDDLCCVSEFFKFIIQKDKYLISAPYLLFFFCKIVTVVLDETIDNFKKYIDRLPNIYDGIILNEILGEIDQTYINYCQTLRNNLHYEEQKSVYIGTPEELYNELGRVLDLTELLLKRIRSVLNINPSKLRLRYYRFLRWVQMPNNKNRKR